MSAELATQQVAKGSGSKANQVAPLAQLQSPGLRLEQTIGRIIPSGQVQKALEQAYHDKVLNSPVVQLHLLDLDSHTKGVLTVRLERFGQQVAIHNCGYEANSQQLLDLLAQGKTHLIKIQELRDLGDLSAFVKVFDEAEMLLASPNPFDKLQGLVGQVVRLEIAEADEKGAAVRFTEQSLTGVIRGVERELDQIVVSIETLAGREATIRSDCFVINTIQRIAPHAAWSYLANRSCYVEPEDFIQRCFFKGTVVEVVYKEKDGKKKSLQGQFVEVSPGLHSFKEVLTLLCGDKANQRAQALAVKSIDSIKTVGYCSESQSPFSQEAKIRPASKDGSYNPVRRQYDFQLLETVYTPRD